MRVPALVLLTATLGGCAVKAQVRTEVEVPPLAPPPPPPRVVAAYPEPEPPYAEAVVEPAAPVKPPPRPRPEQRPEPVAPPPEPVEVARPLPPPSLTLTPSPGTESQTAAAIRDLMDRAGRNLSRVNVNALNHDGRSQLETARRFLQQADEALKAHNIVFAGRLADKAATMAAILVR